ncbi:DUF2911 domain-containing protein [Vicingus serpentipes]|jgi:tetratricopeptide (TPR) repeat protein|uniref:DUF2911 domain-containing protein n=1 Tax=Vicingus serpentipes TaxID=1926625 RepID=A0A5C6RUP8_9FLAO|nr:DUF2911 domain-containing protein [Vicingus serpentipes]TXB65744.1 DUF2911 domain-containing protein [Vicingus serpentipes]
MKKLQTLLLASSFIALTANAQIKAPQPSPTATLTQTIGLTEVEVSYSRPGVKDRVIFGELEKWGNLWRTGANASTKVKFSDPVTVAGNKLAAGEYALYAIPGENEWTIIFNTNLTLWGTGGYKEEEDAVRFTVKPTKLNDKVESLDIDFSHFTYTGANMEIKWENTLISFLVETNAIEQVEKQIKDQLVDGPSAGSYAAAAGFYLENDKDLAQAVTWMDKAIEKRPEAFWYVHTKAKILAKMGNKKEAIETAKKSIEMAKANEGGDYGYVANNEKLIKELEGK